MSIWASAAPGRVSIQVYKLRISRGKLQSVFLKLGIFEVHVHDNSKSTGPVVLKFCTVLLHEGTNYQIDIIQNSVSFYIVEYSFWNFFIYKIYKILGVDSRSTQISTNINFIKHCRLHINFSKALPDFALSCTPCTHFSFNTTQLT